MGKMLSPIVTVPTTVAESFSHHPSNQAQPTEKENLQTAISPQAMNLSLCPPPTPTCSFTTSTTISTTPHQDATPPVVQYSTLALPRTGVQDPILTESVRAEEAGEAFRGHRATLLIAVTDPLILANSLYSSRIVSRETLDRVKLPMLTPTEKNMEIFDAIEAQIKTNLSSFCTLIDILNSDSQLHIFAGRLQQSYGKCYIFKIAEYIVSTSVQNPRCLVTVITYIAITLYPTCMHVGPSQHFILTCMYTLQPLKSWSYA